MGDYFTVYESDNFHSTKLRLPPSRLKWIYKKLFENAKVPGAGEESHLVQLIYNISQKWSLSEKPLKLWLLSRTDDFWTSTRQRQAVSRKQVIKKEFITQICLPILFLFSRVNNCSTFLKVLYIKVFKNIECNIFNILIWYFSHFGRGNKTKSIQWKNLTSFVFWEQMGCFLHLVTYYSTEGCTSHPGMVFCSEFCMHCSDSSILIPSK